MEIVEGRGTMIHVGAVERGVDSTGQGSDMTGVEEMENTKGECQLVPTAIRVSQDGTIHDSY